MNVEASIATDAELVLRCREGDRDAFRDLVERYQSLICSLAYAGCGDLQLSEEIAQETFLTAWRKLGDLREPEKCKSWLCGIARNLTQNSVRRRRGNITAHAEPLDEERAGHSPEISPHEQTVSREEEAMLWSALADLPENYREPMILFYREAESVAAVAAALDISEDAVKQRLARGRVLLTEHIERSMRAALHFSAPGRAFTVGVLAAISALSVSAKAAALGATAVKGGTGVKLAGICGALIGPVLMVAGNYFSYRIGMESARTEGERAHIRRFYLRLVVMMIGFNVIGAAAIWGGLQYRPLLGPAIVVLAVSFVALLGWNMVASNVERRRLLQQRQVLGIPLREAPLWEYRSRFEIFGLPFIHLRFGNSFAGREKAVKAWIAAGDRAFGVLFAFGALAVAPVAVGGMALGLCCWGGLAAGVLALGGVGFGWWVFGGVVFGWEAFGGCALGWHAAMGGVAVARDFALGAIAAAAQGNNAMAREWMRHQAYFRTLAGLDDWIQWLNLLWVIPVLQWWRVVKKRRKESSASSAGVTP